MTEFDLGLISPPNAGFNARRVINFGIRDLPDHARLEEEYMVAVNVDTRGLMATTPSDREIVVVTNNVDPFLVKYLERVGFGPGLDRVYIMGHDKHGRSMTERVLADSRLADELATFIANRSEGQDMEFFPYFSSDGEAVAERLGLTYTRAFSSEYDPGDKVEFKLANIELELPTIPGGVLTVEGSNLESRLAREVISWAGQSPQGKAFLRGDKTSSGVSSYSLRPGDNFREVAEKMETNPDIKRYIVEPKLDNDPLQGSPSVGFRVTKKGEIFRITPVGVQIMSEDKRWLGNIYSMDMLTREVRDEMVARGLKHAKHQREKGIYADFGVDGLVDIGGELYLVEENLRPTGATPLATAHHVLSDRHSASGDLHMAGFFVRMDYLDFKGVRREFDEAGILYDASSPNGVLPYHFRTNGEQSVVGVVAIGTSPSRLRDYVNNVTGIALDKHDELHDALERLVEKAA